VAREAGAGAQRVASLHAPEGMPPEALAQLRAAAAQLGHSSDSAAHEAAFLLVRLQRGLLADGPLGGALGAILGVGLTSPWGALPVVKTQEHHWYDPIEDALGAAKDVVVGRAKSDLDFLDGAWDEATATLAALKDTGLGLAGHGIDGPLGIPLNLLGVKTPSDYIPVIGDRRRKLDKTAAWAGSHPAAFGKAVVKDASAWDDFSHGRVAHGTGRVVFGVAEFFAPVAVAGKAARVSTGATRGLQSSVDASAAASARVGHAADAVQAAGEKLRLTARSGKSIADDLGRLRGAQAGHTRAIGEAQLAHQRIETALQNANAAALHAAHVKDEVPAEELKAVRNHVAASVVKELAHPEEPEEPTR
jgi:hypothetical protein